MRAPDMDAREHSHTETETERQRQRDRDRRERRKERRKKHREAHIHAQNTIHPMCIHKSLHNTAQHIDYHIPSSVSPRLEHSKVVDESRKAGAAAKNNEDDVFRDRPVEGLRYGIDCHTHTHTHTQHTQQV